MPGSIGGRPSVTAPIRGSATISEPVVAEPTPTSNTTTQAGRNAAISVGRAPAPSSAVVGLSGLWSRFSNWLSGKNTNIGVSTSAKQKSEGIAEQANLNYGAAAYYVMQNEQSHSQAEDDKRSKEQPSGIVR